METLRVHYVERQRLRTADLQAEQDYLLGLDLRHNLNQHTPGIIRGLQIRSVSGQFEVEPGIAIDLFGRELVLLEAAPLPINNMAGCLDVWLIYCREPLRLRRPGRVMCSDDTFERWREIPRLLTLPVNAQDDVQPPTEGAVFLGRIACDDRQEINYAGLCGREVADPASRALLQIGPRTTRDPYSFVVSLTDATGTLVRRIAMDRRSNNYLYGSVELRSYRRTVVAPLLNNTLGLMIEANAPGEAVQQIHAEIEDKITNGQVTTRLSLSDAAGKLPSEELTIDGANKSEILKSLNEKLKLARFSLAQNALPGDENVELSSLDGDLRATLTSSRAVLELADWPQDEPAMNQRRGCDVAVAADDLSVGQEPNGLSFLPLAEPLKGKPQPRLYSILVKRDDRRVEQVRLDLGEKKENDSQIRLFVGAPPVAAAPAGVGLAVSGNCLVSLSPGLPLPAALSVKGFIEQAPLKPDPTNPLFRNLLVAAWLAGLRSSILASTAIEITLANLPQLVETTQTWQYTVRIKNKELKEVTVEKLFETRRIGAEQVLLRNLPAAITIRPNEERTITVVHSSSESNPTPAGDLTIEVMASGKVGSIPWWSTGNTASPITVVEPPQLDLSDLPDSVPPSSAWEHKLVINNVATHDLTLKEVVTTEGAQPPLSLLAAPQSLAANGSAEFTVSHATGISADMRVALRIKYEWTSGTERVVALPTPKRIKVEEQLRFDEFDTPATITAETDWSYDLELKNVSDVQLTQLSLAQRLVSGGMPITAFEVIPDLPDSLNADQRVTLSQIAGPQAPATTSGQRVTVEIQATYRHNSRIWELPPTPSDHISVTGVA
jgi:hypothetical protein